MLINAKDYKDFKELNKAIKTSSGKNVEVINLLGERFIGDGLKDKYIKISSGIPGNALGAYLDGAKIEVLGNAQDATGDTMNEGEIIIHGSSGDTCGYAMRGGEIYVRGNTGYRSGIHMKAYETKNPVMVIGNKAGSFLAEYMAGGTIIVLGLDNPNNLVGDFSFTGMYGGKVIVRGNVNVDKTRLNIEPITEEILDEIKPYLNKFAKYFDVSIKEILKEEFNVITPNTNNPFKTLYVAN